eukprot:TRINITY_DN30506_c0_g1_i1.p1 TRINITY_DN30506_c0_g1~~TRINITY_DN30506_c0_g1_i1.p1  ORF type:complete len:159 (+),score=15.01 TRINITY_DN30506_c0_g1_i1:8-484(+)
MSYTEMAPSCFTGSGFIRDCPLLSLQREGVFRTTKKKMSKKTEILSLEQRVANLEYQLANSRYDYANLRGWIDCHVATTSLMYTLPHPIDAINADVGRRPRGKPKQRQTHGYAERPSRKGCGTTRPLPMEIANIMTKPSVVAEDGSIVTRRESENLIQ